MSLNKDEDLAMLDKAREILDLSPSWATKDFIEDLLWHGYGGSDEVRHFQRCRLKELITLYGV